MGKKKNKKQPQGEGSKRINKETENAASAVISNGFNKKKINPGNSTRASPQETPPSSAPESRKRKGDFPGLRNDKKKKRQDADSQPGRFVRIRRISTEEEDETTDGIEDEDSQPINTENSNLSIVKKSDFEDESSSESSDTDDTFDSSFHSTSSQSGNEDYSEDYDFQSNSDDTYSLSEEEAGEEFSTDTDYTDDGDQPASNYFDYHSDEDGDYEPGARYDDVIVRPGEAKFREKSNLEIYFSDPEASDMIEYISDTNEEAKVEKIQVRQEKKSVDPCKDTRKAVIHIGDVSLDTPPNFHKEKPEIESKKEKIKCSKNCLHHTLPRQTKKIAKENPLNALAYDGEEISPSLNDSVVESEIMDGSVNPETSEVDEVATEEPQFDTTDAMDEVEDHGSVKFYNSIDSYHVLLHLTESVHFHGNLSIKLLAGSASVLGYKLDVNETVTAHAPVGHSSVSITPNSSNFSKHWKESLSKGNKFIREIFHDEDLKEIDENYTDSQAILLLTKTSNKSIKMVKKYSSSRVFPNMINYKRPRLFASTEYILGCRFSMDSRYHFQLNPDWEMISLGEKSRVVVTGGKNVGKSTLVRHLVNQNVKKYGKVLLIDLDVGQSEVFVPQTVSAALLDGPILGLGCFAEKVPVKSYIFGDLSVANDPQKYIECVAKLIRDLGCESRYSNIPWIVNTMGYAKGIGLELMIAILRLISPTDVIQIHHEIQLENFDYEITKDLVANWSWIILDGDVLQLDACKEFRTFIFHTMVSGNLAAEIRKAKSSETRQINILAHLGGILGENCDWITQSKPVCVPLDKLKLFNFTDEDIDVEQIYDLLNANLVYLCKKSDDGDILECLGIGIVRGIDEFSRNLYLLPSTRENLLHVNSLAVCRITLPPQLILNQNSNVRGELPFVYNTNEAIGSRNVVERAFRSEKAMSNIYSQENMRDFE